MVKKKAKKMPKATYKPNICTGGIGVNASDANPIDDVVDVNSIGVNKLLSTVRMVFFGSSPGLWSSANSESIWIESTTAIGIKKIGIIELMM